jgi:peptidyl-prolyl cis-trans isomerase B (cyclophilin B)
MRKRLLSLCMISVIAAGLTACGEKPSNETTSGNATQATTEAPASETVNKDVLEQQYAGPKVGDTIASIHVKDMGTIQVHFFPEQAPKAVENFVTHSQNGYYDGVSFHRVINDFMIQGGDPEGTGAGGESIWGEDFENECTDELLVTRGSLCMANAGPDTNGSQFFITQVPAEIMSEQYFSGPMTQEMMEVYMEKGGAPWLQGQHTVFGQVFNGMDVVDAIAAMDSDGQGTPSGPIIIENIEISTYEE